MAEIAVVIFVALLVFGATRVSSLGDALGRALRGPPPPEAPPPKPPREEPEPPAGPEASSRRG